MRFKILTIDNKAGVVVDALLLKDIIEKNITTNVEIVYMPIDNFELHESSDVGVWIQNPCYFYLKNFKTNIYFCNEEWASHLDCENIKKFDYVIVKNKFAKQLLDKYAPNPSNVICLPFVSPDRYDPNIERTNKFFHLGGKSIQKNTEVVVKVHSKPITVIDATCKFLNKDLPPNIDYVHEYVSFDEINQMMNSHSAHICPSLYESWGHYLYEGLSTGAEIICSDIPPFSEHLDKSLIHMLPVKEGFDMNYWYCSDNVPEAKAPERKYYFVDEKEFCNLVENFEPIGKEEQRRQMFHDIMSTNKRQIIEFFKNL